MGTPDIPEDNEWGAIDTFQAENNMMGLTSVV